MNRMNRSTRVALAALALLGLALPGIAQAQQPAKDMVAFKATWTAVTTEPVTLMIPTAPPILSVRLAGGSGQSELLGPFTLTSHHYLRLGADGNGLTITDGVAAFTGEQGNALSLTYSGFFRFTDGLPSAEMRFVITGGTGRFAGATGSGVFLGLAKPLGGEKYEWTSTYDGIISAPKP